MKRVGIDVGGTFTDLIYVDEDQGQVVVHKLPSTPSDPAQATLLGLDDVCERAGVEPASLDHLFHGTTVATNIVLEHTGAKVGMLTTKGYRDILHIARHKRPLSFSLYQDVPWQQYPLVRRRYRRPITERVIAPDGEVLAPLNEDEVREAVRMMKAEGVEAVAICFLFSFLNSSHEQRAKEIVREEFPECYLSVRHEVLPQYREYEGFSTVCLNASIGPKVSQYIERLDRTVTEKGMRGGLHLMTSVGGVATPQGAMQRPVNLLMSGPVAGLIGGIWTGKMAGSSSVITLDVGGTSADIGVAPDGQTRMKHLLDTQVGGYHAMIPMVEIDAIGAGGGSIAYIDAGGMFRVGPKSAGAEPGPACYGQGGDQATATDALVVLGRLRPESFLGGRIPLQKRLAEEAIERQLCRPLGTDLEQAALGVARILTHGMIEGIEISSVRKGYDPRDFALVAAGGAGPLFACDIAQELGIPQVLVPRYPGITSALGLLATDIVYEFVTTEMQLFSSLDRDKLSTDFATLERQATERLRADRLDPEHTLIRRIADCRYIGQGYELRVELPAGPIDHAWQGQAVEAFHQAHEREYVRRFPDSDIQIVNIRVQGVGLMPELRLKELPAGDPSPTDALTATHDVTFSLDDKPTRLASAFYQRELLKAGNRIDGPAIIEQLDSTVVINPGLTAQVDQYGTILIDCR
jgi:5-oxoprolinase (ATP-hydrolysing)/N-methylhydantoinase A